MNFSALPFLEATLAVPLLGSLLMLYTRTSGEVLGRGVIALSISLASAIVASLNESRVLISGLTDFRVDSLSAPMLPVMLLLHLLALLGTAKSRLSPAFCTRILVSASVHAGSVTCHSNGILILLLLAAVVLPAWELLSEKAPVRGFLIYMFLFAAGLTTGWIGNDPQATRWAGAVMLAAILLRGAIVPFHSWVPILFREGSLGTAMLFVTPMVEILAVSRLVLPGADSRMLDLAAFACLVTAVYGAGMAVIQGHLRTFFAYVSLSQTSLVMFGLMLHTPNSLTAALCLWISSSVTLAGLSFALRAITDRFGECSLRDYHGHYDQVPGLAVCFILAGLASVGFPGTMGFVPMELLFSGSADRGLGISAALAVAAMLNGIAILRAYFSVFTGRRPVISISLRTTRAERAGIILVVVLVILGGWFSPGVVESRHRVAESMVNVVP